MEESSNFKMESSFKIEQDRDFLKKEELLTKKNINKFKKFFFRKNLLIFITLIILLFLAWHVRTANVPKLKDITTGEYTLGPDLDPFLFLRYTKQIVNDGKIAEHDSMRYVPLGFDTSKETKLLPYMIAHFHKILNFFSPVSIEYSAVIFPAFMFLLVVVFFFFFILKVFENHKKRYIIALISTIFLILSPSLIPRTVAGIPEKESAGFFFMFSGFYLFLAAWKSKTTFKKSLILAVLAGISSAALQLIWGGWIYIFITISIYTFLAFIFDKINKKEFLIYSIWLLLATIIPILFSERYNFNWLIVSIPSLAGIAVFAIILIDFLIFKTKIKNFNFIERLRKKFPSKIISLLIMVIFSLSFILVFFGFSFVFRFVQSAIIPTFSTDRLSSTVSENRQPYFAEWKESFGPTIKGIPVFFWLFFLASIFFFYEIIKKVRLKERILLVSSYILFLFGAIFNRYSPDSALNGDTGISKIIYFGSFLLLIIVSCYFWYKCYKEKRFRELKSINFSYLILFIFFILSLFGARGAVRLMMVLVPPASAVIGFFIVYVIEKAMKKQQDEILKLFLILLIISVMITGIYAIYFNYHASVEIAKSTAPSGYEHQWQKAMAWVRENTQENAVFAHWWDYGYWVQTIGKRATVLDGGNAIGYWNHLLARHVLTGESEKEALEFLYAHNATHLLIDSQDIRKYWAFSSIGSDENYDRYSWIEGFSLNDKKLEQQENETIYIYMGDTFLDEDYLFEEEGQTFFFPARRAKIVALLLSVSNKKELKQPKAIFVYQNKQITIPLRYLYYEEKLYDFNEGYKGSLYVIPGVIQENGEFKINKLGSALFLSEMNMRTLWVRLYLLGEGDKFKLVHTENNIIIEYLKNSEHDTGDFVYYGGTKGPIKIWEINYPKDIKFKEEYLSTEYPLEITLVKT